MVHIVTDSASDFEPEEVSELGLHCVPLSVAFGSAVYQENVNLSKKMFYQLLEYEQEIPRTSQPSPQKFVSILRTIQEAGDQAIVITMSSVLSGTFQGATLAKNMLNFEECYVVDSLTATAGERLLVETALKLRARGREVHEIVKVLEELRTRISLYACMDSLKYLYKGGRISGTPYLLGSMMSIKPILHVSKTGCAEIPAKVRGVRKGISYLAEKLIADNIDPAYPPYVVYTGESKNGELLVAELHSKGISIPTRHFVQVGAVVEAHIGSDAFGIVYVAKHQ